MGLKERIYESRKDVLQGIMDRIFLECGKPDFVEKSDHEYKALYGDNKRFVVISSDIRRFDFPIAVFEDHTFVRPFIAQHGPNTSFRLGPLPAIIEFVQEALLVLKDGVANKDQGMYWDYSIMRLAQIKNRKRIKYILSKLIIHKRDNPKYADFMIPFEIARANGVPAKELLELWERMQKNVLAAESFL